MPPTLQRAPAAGVLSRVLQSAFSAPKVAPKPRGKARHKRFRAGRRATELRIIEQRRAALKAKQGSKAAAAIAAAARRPAARTTSARATRPATLHGLGDVMTDVGLMQDPGLESDGTDMFGVQPGWVGQQLAWVATIPGIGLVAFPAVDNRLAGTFAEFKSSIGQDPPLYDVHNPPQAGPFLIKARDGRYLQLQAPVQAWGSVERVPEGMTYIVDASGIAFGVGSQQPQVYRPKGRLSTKQYDDLRWDLHAPQMATYAIVNALAGMTRTVMAPGTDAPADWQLYMADFGPIDPSEGDPVWWDPLQPLPLDLLDQGAAALASNAQLTAAQVLPAPLMRGMPGHPMTAGTPIPPGHPGKGSLTVYGPAPAQAGGSPFGYHPELDPNNPANVTNPQSPYYDPTKDPASSAYGAAQGGGYDPYGGGGGYDPYGGYSYDPTSGDFYGGPGYDPYGVAINPGAIDRGEPPGVGAQMFSPLLSDEASDFSDFAPGVGVEAFPADGDFDQGDAGDYDGGNSDVDDYGYEGDGGGGGF